MSLIDDIDKQLAGMTFQKGKVYFIWVIVESPKGELIDAKVRVWLEDAAPTSEYPIVATTGQVQKPFKIMGKIENTEIMCVWDKYGIDKDPAAEQKYLPFGSKRINFKGGGDMGGCKH